MMFVVICGAATGAVLGLRPLRVFVLAPALLLVAVCALANGFASGPGPRTIVFGLMAAVACPQIAYFGAAIATQYLRSRAVGRSRTLLHAMQLTIGQELRTMYELPRELPPEMVALLVLMK